jgi:hypothetical protein
MKQMFGLFLVFIIVVGISGSGIYYDRQQQQLRDAAIQELYNTCKYREGDLVSIKGTFNKGMIIDVTNPLSWKRNIPEYRIRLAINPAIPGFPFDEQTCYREFELEKQ